jgi:hypothetical protein
MKYEDTFPSLSKDIRVRRQLFSEVSRAVNEVIRVDGEGFLIRTGTYVDINRLGRSGIRLACLLVL